MAYDIGGRDISFLAAESLATHQYRFVTQADDNQVQMLNAGTDFPVGILQNAPTSGEVAVVRVDGTSKLVANAALSVGAQVKAEYVGASDNGKAEAADTEGDIARGVVIQASGAEDDLCGVLLICNELSVPAS